MLNPSEHRPRSAAIFVECVHEAEFPAGVFELVFADVNNQMHRARQEIFGPVLSIIPFDGEEEAIRIANDSDHGLTANLQTVRTERVRRLAGHLRVGVEAINRHCPAPG